MIEGCGENAVRVMYVHDVALMYVLAVAALS